MKNDDARPVAATHLVVLVLKVRKITFPLTTSFHSESVGNVVSLVTANKEPLHLLRLQCWLRCCSSRPLSLLRRRKITAINFVRAAAAILLWWVSCTAKG